MKKQMILSLIILGSLALTAKAFDGGPVTSGGGDSGVEPSVVECETQRDNTSAVFRIDKVDANFEALYQNYSPNQQHFVRFTCEISKVSGELYICQATESCVADASGTACVPSNLVATVDKYGTVPAVTIAPKNSDSDILDEMVCRVN